MPGDLDLRVTLRLLLEEREGLVRQRTALINQVRASLRRLGARFDAAAGPLRGPCGARRVLGLEAGALDLVGQAQLAPQRHSVTRANGLPRTGYGAGVQGPRNSRRTRSSFPLPAETTVVLSEAKNLRATGPAKGRASRDPGRAFVGA